MTPRIQSVMTIARGKAHREITSALQIVAQASPAGIDRVPKMADFESDSTSVRRTCEPVEWSQDCIVSQRSGLSPAVHERL